MERGCDQLSEEKQEMIIEKRTQIDAMETYSIWGCIRVIQPRTDLIEHDVSSPIHFRRSVLLVRDLLTAITTSSLSFSSRQRSPYFLCVSVGEDSHKFPLQFSSLRFLLRQAYSRILIAILPRPRPRARIVIAVGRRIINGVDMNPDRP